MYSYHIHSNENFSKLLNFKSTHRRSIQKLMAHNIESLLELFIVFNTPSQFHLRFLFILSSDEEVTYILHTPIYCVKK